MSAGYVIYSLDSDKFRQFVERPTRPQSTALAGLLRDELEEYEDEFDAGDPVAKWPKKKSALAELAASRLALPDWYGDLSAQGKTVWEGAIFNACMDSDDIDVGFRVDNDGVYWDVIEAAWKQLGVVPHTISDVAMSQFGTRPYRCSEVPRQSMSRDEHESAEGGRIASAQAINAALGDLLNGLKSGKLNPDMMLEQLQAAEGISPQHKRALADMLGDDDDDFEDDDEADDIEDSFTWSPIHSMHTPEETKQIAAELRSIEAAMKAIKKTDVRMQYQEDLLPAIERIAADGRMLFIHVNT